MVLFPAGLPTGNRLISGGKILLTHRSDTGTGRWLPGFLLKPPPEFRNPYRQIVNGDPVAARVAPHRVFPLRRIQPRYQILERAWATGMGRPTSYANP